MSETFCVGVTRDFLRPDGSPAFGDVGLDRLAAKPGVEWEYLAEYTPEIAPEVAARYDALLVLAPRITARSLAQSQRLKLVARFGVGYDTVDVSACTAHDVLLSITPDGIRRPMAVTVMTLLLALASKLLIKDRITRSGRWNDRLDYPGVGLSGRTLGVIGLGNIGREVFRLVAPLEMRHVGHDPHVSREAAAAAGITWLPLEELLATADFVAVCCALTAETHHLLGASRLALLKPTAFLINAARGPIVDQQALTAVLAAGKIQGAGLDVFETEPIDPADPLLKMEHVIVTPHALCWTDECYAGNGKSACQSILDVAAGRAPASLVNREVLDRPGYQAKLRRTT